MHAALGDLNSGTTYVVNVRKGLLARVHNIGFCEKPKTPSTRQTSMVLPWRSYGLCAAFPTSGVSVQLVSENETWASVVNWRTSAK